jgi:hypothetical protein
MKSSHIIHNPTPKSERRVRGNDARDMSASIVYVVMPCCGTSRGLHDDRTGPQSRTCRKCGAGWWVTYLGAGRFRFSKKS